MFTKRDQESLASAYGLVSEMNLGPAGEGMQPVGKPVVIAVDLPGAKPEFKDNNEEDYENEYDSSEIEMACEELHKICDLAPKLKAMVEQMPGLEGWISSKITKASDYICSVYHWLEYQQHENKGECGCNHGEDMYDMGYEDTEECPYAAMGCKCGGCPDCN
jgi:hypothetical protein